MERTYVRASNPKSGPDAGPSILSPGLWREGSFQKPYPLLAFFKNVVLMNPLHYANDVAR